ncbi:hypothetical protein [uncultured Aquimarina sp.]|uniref:hypothetical protein n=1 Tax=uncultured Aquimarina sp. TaxID=575652 RepID=UPI002601B1EA|nr:hypothetical protein [uncultured Aquimarina sp.]
MTKRKRVSSSAINRRKYFTSWFTLVFIYFFTKMFDIDGFWFLFLWIVGFLTFIWNLRLSKVEYTSDKVYFNNKEFDYESIVDINSIVINQVEFFVFKTNSGNWKKRYFTTEFGEIGIWGLIKLFLKSIKTDEIPQIEFLQLLKEKSKIDRRKFKKY